MSSGFSAASSRREMRSRGPIQTCASGICSPTPSTERAYGLGEPGPGTAGGAALRFAAAAEIAPAGELDDEGGSPCGEAHALPAGRRSARSLKALVGKTAEARVAPEHGHVRIGAVDDVERLVVPDRERGLDPEDEGAHCSVLRLRERLRPRVVAVPGPPVGRPRGRPVAVEVDAVGVLPRPRRKSVRVDRRHQPQVDACRESHLPQSRDHGQACGLGSVDDADDERDRPGRVASLVRDEGAPAHRVPDQGAPSRLRRGCGQPRGGERRDDHCAQHHGVRARVISESERDP